MKQLENQVRIIIAGSQFLMLRGLRAVLDEVDGIEIVAEADDAGSLASLAAVHQPDLLIIDRNFGDFFSEANLEASNAFMSGHRVIIFSDFDKESIYRIHKLSITGFLTTASGADEISEAIRAAAKGVKYFSPKIVEVLIELSFKRMPEKQEARLHEGLSEREMEIFRLVTQGRSTREIADELFLSTHTVYTHRKNILKKLSCKSAAELINYAYTQGLVEKEG